MPALSIGLDWPAAEGGPEGGPGINALMPLSILKSLPTSGMTLRGRPLKATESNDGTLGRATGREELLSSGRFGKGFMA